MSQLVKHFSGKIIKFLIVRSILIVIRKKLFKKINKILILLVISLIHQR